MRELLIYLVMEWRILRRGPFIWVLCLLAASLSWIVISETGNTHSGYLVHQYQFLFIAPMSILALLVGVHTARRDTALKIDKIMGSLPYRSSKQLVARYITTAVPFIGIALLPACLWLYLTASSTISFQTIIHGSLVLASVVIGLLFIMAVGMSIGSLINGRSSYFFAFIIWFLLIYGGMFVTRFLPGELHVLFNFLLIDLKTVGFFDELWGISNDLTYWLHRGFYAGLTMLLLVAIGYLLAKRRNEPLDKKRYFTAGVIVLAITSTFLYSYLDMKHARIVTYETRVEAAWQAQKESNIAHSADLLEDQVLSVAHYDLVVSYLEDGSLGVDATLYIDPFNRERIDELSFTLKDIFQVAKVTLNGEVVEFKRDGNILSFSLMDTHALGEGIELQLSYTGRVDDWRVIHVYSNPDQIIIPTHIANEQQLFLPANYGWYPIPGKHQLQTVVRNRYDRLELRDSYYPDQYSDYTITVVYPNRLEVFSNLTQLNKEIHDDVQITHYQGKSVRGASLLGGELQEISYTAGDTQVKAIVSKLMNTEQTQDVAKIYHEVNLALEHVLQLPMEELSFFAHDYYKGSSMGRNSDLGGLLAVSSYMFTGYDLSTDVNNRYSENVVKTLIEARLLQNDQITSAHHDYTDILTAYLLYYMHDIPIDFTSNFSPWVKLEEHPMYHLENYLNTHTAEENEAMLREMYQLVMSNPAISREELIALSISWEMR